MEILNCKKRIPRSSHSVRNDRKQGRIPGILYGKGIQNILFETGELEFNQEIKKVGDHGIINIDIDGVVYKGLIKEIQRDSINHKILHIDIEQFSSNKIVNTEIPICFEGEDLVNISGGIIQKEKDSIKVHCKADFIPKTIKIDLGKLKIGDCYRMADLELSNEISIDEDMNAVIATITKANTKIIDEPEETDRGIYYVKENVTEIQQAEE